MAINGTSCLVRIKRAGESKIIAGQQNATLNRDYAEVDITTKESAGNTETMLGDFSWSIDCDGLFTYDNTSNDLEEAFMTREKFEAEIEIKGIKYEGFVVCTSLPISCPSGEAITYSTTLKGTGPLTRVVSSEE